MKNNFFFSEQKGKFPSFLLAVFSTIHKQALLGLLFVLTSIPILTLFCSWSALCMVSKKIIAGEEVRTAKDYFSFFFVSLKRKGFLSVVFSAFFAVGVYCARIYFSFKTLISFFGGILCVSFVLIAVLLFIFIPFKADEKSGLLGFLEIFAPEIPRCMLALFSVFLFCGVPVLLLPYTIPIVLTFSFPLSSLCCAFVLDKRSDKE